MQRNKAKLIPKALLFTGITMAAFSAHAQQRIADGTVNTPINGAAVLELQSTNKGFLPSRVALTDRLLWSPMAGTATKGMIVYNTATGGANGLDTGLVIWEGRWNSLSNASQSDYWRLNGNSGTTAPASTGAVVGTFSFWGTTDANSLGLGTNNITRAIFDTAGNIRGGGTGNINQPGNANNIIWGTGNVINTSPSAAFYNQNGSNAIFGSSNTATGATQNGGNLVSGLSNLSYNATNNILSGQFNKDSSYANAVSGGNNTVSPAASYTDVSGSNNYVTNPWNIVGGSGNKVYAAYSLVAGSGNFLNGANGSALVAGAGNIDSASYTLAAGEKDTLTSTADHSFVMGGLNKLAGNYSLVSGYGNKVGSTATYSEVLGYNNQSQGSFSFAAGKNNNILSNGTASIALGLGNYVPGFNSFAAGGYDTASGYGSAAMGWYCKASGSYALAQGFYTSATGNNAIALGGLSGYTNVASGLLSFVAGAGNVASGTLSTAFGTGCNVSTGNSYAFGDGLTVNATSADGNFATGSGNTITGYGHSAIFGYANSTAGDCSAIFGAFNQSVSNGDFVIGSANAFRSGTPNGYADTDTRFQIGNGPAYNSYANAVTVLKNGKMAIGIHTVRPALALEINGKDGVLVPVGATTDRPAAPAFGTLRYNSDLGRPEMYVNDLDGDGVQGDAGWLKL